MAQAKNSKIKDVKGSVEPVKSGLAKMLVNKVKTAVNQVTRVAKKPEVKIVKKITIEAKPVVKKVVKAAPVATKKSVKEVVKPVLKENKSKEPVKNQKPKEIVSENVVKEVKQLIQAPIAIAPDEKAVHTLLVKGRSRGFVTETEILFLFPEVEDYLYDYEVFLEDIQ